MRTLRQIAADGFSSRIRLLAMVVTGGPQNLAESAAGEARTGLNWLASSTARKEDSEMLRTLAAAFYTASLANRTEIDCRRLMRLVDLAEG